MRSISASSAAVGRHVIAAAFALTCSGEVAPAMTEAMPGCAASHENASSRRVCPRCETNSINASTIARLRSVYTFGPNPAWPRLPSGGGPPAPVLARKQPTSEREIRQEREHLFVALGQHLRFRFTVQQAVFILDAYLKRAPPGRTAAAASRSCAAEKFEQPISRILPAFTKSSRAPSVSAMGISGSGR